MHSPTTGRDGELHDHPRAAGKVIAGLLCAALVVISLAALRNTTTPDAPVKLMAGSRVDFTRLASARASRGTPRLSFPITTLPPTTTTLLPPPTTVKPKAVVVKKATPPSTAKPKPTPTTAKPKPPAATNTPTTTSSVAEPAPGPNTNSDQGKASWYEAKYHERDPWICAHKTLPMGTVLTVTATATGRSITCHVGDRGPYVDGRILDLSKYAFSQLANPSAGVVSVKISW